MYQLFVSVEKHYYSGIACSTRVRFTRAHETTTKTTSTITISYISLNNSFQFKATFYERLMFGEDVLHNCIGVVSSITITNVEFNV